MEANIPLNSNLQNPPHCARSTPWASLAFWLLSVLTILSMVLLGPAPLFFAGFNTFFGMSLVDSSAEIDWHTMISALKFSVWQAATSASITVFVALFFARALYYSNSRATKLILTLARIPFGLPSVIVSFAFIVTYGNSGILNTFLQKLGFQIPFLYNKWTIVHAHVYFNLGMCAAALLERYNHIPKELQRTSEILDLGFWQHIKNVELPQLASSIRNLWIIVFCYCLTSFAIIITLGGSPAYTSLEVLIYQFVKYDLNFRSAFVASIIQIVLLLVTSFLISKSSESKDSKPLAFHEGSRKRLRFLPESLLHFCVLLIVSVFVALPLMGIFADSFRITSDLFTLQTNQDKAPFLVELLGALVNSFKVALPVALMSAIFAFVTAQAMIRISDSLKNKGRFFVNFFTYFLIALSPTAIGFSWIASLVFLEIDPLTRSTHIIVLVQTFLFSPLSIRIMYPVLEESFAMWKKTYKAYGINTGMQAFYVELNAVRKTLLNCFFMTLAFSIGDVSVPMLFANPQFRSLSVLLLDCLGSYQFEKASLTSLLLIISTQAALLMVWWGTKLNKSRDGNFNRIKTHA